MLALARSALALLAVAMAAAASAAPPSSIAVPLPPPPPGTSLSRPARTILVAGKAGIASPLGNGGDGSPMIEVEAAIPWRTTASGIALGWALPLRTTFLSTTKRFGLESGGVALELTPTARASVPLGRSSVSFRTEAGLGIVNRWTSQQVDTQFLGRRTDTGQSMTGIVRMGFALDWAVRPRLSVALEPLSFGFDFRGNADWIFAGGLTYRL